MLFTLSLAFLLPFISAASLPVLHPDSPDSPDSNHAIFQNLNTKSLPTSILALTTNSSSLGLVNAHAYDPPPRYPPGYPGQPYDYPVRQSHIRIHCYKFTPDPLQNPEYLDDLFAKLHRKYSDPRDYSVHLWSEDSEFYWDEGDERIGQSALSLHLPLAVDRPDFNMTYGEFSNVLIGLNHLRHDYPMLKIDSKIYREGDLREIGLMWLETYDPVDPDDPDAAKMTEELIRKAE